MSYRCFDTNDTISFGQMQNEPFKWIYLLTTPYLVWLIENTDVCFTDLDLFYTFGYPLKLDETKLTSFQENKFKDLIRKYGKNIYKEPGKAFLVTIELFAKSIEQNILTPSHFKYENFEFNSQTIEANHKKVKSSIAVYNITNVERDKYLTSLFSH